MNRRKAILATLAGIIGIMTRTATEDKIAWTTQVYGQDPCDFATKNVRWDMTCFEKITLTCGDIERTITREEILDALAKR